MKTTVAKSTSRLFSVEGMLSFEEWIKKFEQRWRMREDYEDELAEWIDDCRRINPTYEAAWIRRQCLKDFPYQKFLRERYDVWVAGYMEGLERVRAREATSSKPTAKTKKDVPLSRKASSRGRATSKTK